MMVTTLPDAFLVEFSGVESNGQLKFAFQPNPKFSPKNRRPRCSKACGAVCIDPKDERIARIQADLFKDVNFGWGILGRLYKGGRFEVVQSQISPGIWRITTLSVDFKGRVFLFTPLRIFRIETSREFIPSPADLTAREALSRLLSRPLVQKARTNSVGPAAQ